MSFVPRHDAFFREVFEHPENAVPVLRHVMSTELAELIDWSSLALVSGSHVQDDLAQLHNDLVFTARLRGTRGLVYVLFEHQSTNDPEMAFRLHEYEGRIWNRHRVDHRGEPYPPIVAVVLSHAGKGWTAARRFSPLFLQPLPAVLAEFVPDFPYLVDDLHIASNEELAARDLPVHPKLALWLLRDSRMPAVLVRNIVFWRPVIEEACQSPSAHDIFRTILWYLDLALPNTWYKKYCDAMTALIPATKPYVARYGRRLLDDIKAAAEERGEARGREEGRAIGREEGLRMAIELAAKALGVSLDERRRESLAAACAPELEALQTHLLTFRDWPS